MIQKDNPVRFIVGFGVMVMGGAVVYIAGVCAIGCGVVWILSQIVGRIIGR